MPTVYKEGTQTGRRIILGGRDFAMSEWVSHLPFWGRGGERGGVSKRRHRWSDEGEGERERGREREREREGEREKGRERGTDKIPNYTPVSQCVSSYFSLHQLSISLAHWLKCAFLRHSIQPWLPQDVTSYPSLPNIPHTTLKREHGLMKIGMLTQTNVGVV